MTSIAPVPAETAVNFYTGKLTVTVASSAPSFTAGLLWQNSSTGHLNAWNGTAWADVSARYLMLLYADPATSGPGGGPALQMPDLVECADTGYARQAVTFTAAAPVSGGYPPVSASNTAAVTFGPFGIDMTGTASWVALVSSSSGTSGLYLWYWNVPADQTQQVTASNSITIPAGTCVIDQA